MVTCLALMILAAPLPFERTEGLIWLHDTKSRELRAYNPRGTLVRTLAIPADQTFLALTPDGRHILYARDTYRLRPVGREKPETDLGVKYEPNDRVVCWNPEGTTFVRIAGGDARSFRGARLGGFDLIQERLTLVRPATKTSETLSSPLSKVCVGWTDQGLVFTTHSADTLGLLEFIQPDKKTRRVTLSLTNLRINRIKESPRDRRLLAPGFTDQAKGRDWYQGIWLIDPKTGQTSEWMHETGQGYTDAHWSPDGQNLVALWGYMIAPESGNGWDEMRLTIARSDGTHRRTITLRDKARKEDPYGLTLLGWFPTR